MFVREVNPSSFKYDDNDGGGGLMVVMAKSVESLLCFCWQVVLKSSSHSMVSELKERPLNKQLKAANEEAGY